MVIISMRPPTNDSGFTLAEGLVSLGVFSIFAAAATMTLLHLNRFAMVERTRTNAKELCQEKIEEAMAAPFNPGMKQVGAVLGGSWPITNPAPESVDVVIDFDNTKVIAKGSRTTTVAVADASSSLLRVSVEVTYDFRGKPYTYQMGMLRAPD
jgi:prepilin-type N-terminal cleavage/methylation domain-containing protein